MADKSYDPPSTDPHADHERVLALRAEAVARVQSGNGVIGDEISVAAFQIADEVYAIELPHVREIFPVKELTFIPGAPGFIAGIVNVRGEIFSVVDLRHFFEIPDNAESSKRHIIILQSTNMAFGVLADAVLGVNRISPSMLQSSVSTLTGIRSKYLKGIAEGRLIVLDAARLLEDPNMYIYQE